MTRCNFESYYRIESGLIITCVGLIILYQVFFHYSFSTKVCFHTHTKIIKKKKKKLFKNNISFMHLSVKR